MAKKKPAPVADVPMIEAVPTPPPITDPASDAGATSEPVVEPAPDAQADTPQADASPKPADEPPAQVIVTFDRPPAEVEMEIRVHVTEGKDLVGVRAYRTWANGREGVDTEGGPAKLGLLEAQDAVRWLVAQPMPAGAVEEPPVETLAEGAGREVVHLAQPNPRPVLTVAPPAPPARTKILATRSIQHEYTLTDDERIALGSALANLEADCENEEADQAAKKRAMRERLSGLRGERARVADIIRRGAEVRTIPVIDVIDYEDRIVRTMHEETCEVIKTRELDPHESQLPLFGALKPAAEPEAKVDDGDPFAVDEGDADTDTDTDEEEEEDEEPVE